MAKELQVVTSAFNTLWNDVAKDGTFPDKRPLLAHYTSIQTLEAIASKEELWFSNPLYMNDLEELRFGVIEGAQAFRTDEGVRNVCGSEERYRILSDAFEAEFQRFDATHAFDTYVFCLSEVDENDTDGLLSMWRGYGGSGSGAAIVFDSAQINHVPDSPLVISNVTYGSAEQRRAWIRGKIAEFAGLIAKTPVPNELLPVGAKILFERIKMFALFTKHIGFSEEKEWRVVYLSERDVNGYLKSMLHYTIGPRGVEPKLKFKIAPIDGVTTSDLSLSKLVKRIILGPTVSSPLAGAAVRRMLQKVGKSVLSDVVVTSAIPFRGSAVL